MDKSYVKGQGAQSRIHNRFERLKYVQEHPEGIDVNEEEESLRTKFIDVSPKTIISKNSSPDVPFDYSINPYQGCEHGCVYCYARNSHEYWGYNASTDFERVVLVKRQAAQILASTFRKKSYQPELIVIAGNTDAYQPIERKLGVTRELLKVFQAYNHPLGLITKNSLILRDLDILSDMASKNLCSVTISLTSLNEDTRKKMEPRTASVSQRLKAIQELSEAGIPVNVNLAPIIPAINSHEIFDLVQAAASHGAQSVNYILVRLNGAIAGIFEEWVTTVHPDRASKVLKLIKETHDGALNESQWGKRMTGEGVYADQVKQMFNLARNRFLPKTKEKPLDYSRFLVPDRGKQSQLFME